MPRSTGTTIRFSESSRTRMFRRPERRWPIVAIAAVSLAAAVWLFNRDTRWEARWREARARGQIAEMNSHPEAAREYYTSALSRHPYDWEMHLALGRVLYYWLDDHDNALRHYLYAMAYCPEQSQVDEMATTTAILTLLRDGELEDPIHAIEDMFAAAAANAPQIFRQRLDPGLEKDFDLFWKAWRERGRGKVLYKLIRQEGESMYDCAIEIAFPDGVNLCLRLQCRRHDIWRMNISFP